MDTVQLSKPVWVYLLFSCSGVSDSLWPHGWQHSRLPHPSLSPRGCSNSYPLSQWCHPTISSSVTRFFSCPQSFPASGSFPVSQLFASGGQGIKASASVSVLPVNIQDWFPLGLTVWSPCSPRDSQESSPAPQFESVHSLVLSLLYGPPVTFVYWKNHSFDYLDLCWQSLLFNMLSRLVITFLPRSNHLNFMAVAIICSDFGAQEDKVCHHFRFFPIYLLWSVGTGMHDLNFLNVGF